MLTVLGYRLPSHQLARSWFRPDLNQVLNPRRNGAVSLGALNNAGAGGGWTVAGILTGTLQPTGGCDRSPRSTDLGSLCPLSLGAARTFTFTVDPGLACGDVVTASLTITDGAVNYGTITYPFKVGSLIPVALENFDGPIAPALPNQWATSATGASALGEFHHHSL